MFKKGIRKKAQVVLLFRKIHDKLASKILCFRFFEFQGH